MNDPLDPIVVNGWFVDDSLLEEKPISRCRIEECRAGCCADGVWVDMDQARAIMDHAEMIMPFMPQDRRKSAEWFAEHYNDDSAFPSGEYIGTTTVVDASHPAGTTCVFLRPEDRFCAIQAASLANGLSAWALKPYYCCLFPLVDEHSPEPATRKIMLDSGNSLFEHGGGCNERSELVHSVFQVYAEETATVLGVDGYRELCRRVGVEPKL